MAAPPNTPFRRKLVAIDTCVLFHLAEQHAPSHNLVLRLVRMGMQPMVSQTVVQELGHLAEHHPNETKRRMAETALATMRSWGIEPVALKPVGNGISDVIADLIANRGLLPEEEKNDAYIVIEAGICGAAMLVTYDPHLLNAPQSALNEVLISFDLRPVQIVAPKVILGD